MIWLSRDLVTGPYLALCTKESQYRKAMRDCNVPPDKTPPWVCDGADATTHTLTNKEGRLTCIVTLSSTEGKSSVQVAAMLVHEAVHVWQQFKESIGEHSPSPEFEAYSIQAVCQRLFEAYAGQRSDER